MDLSESIQPNSEQVNAEDLLVAPRTVTITGVEEGTKDQPVFIHLAEFPGRTYRPAKSMRRVISACWGVDSSAYTGRRMTLYTDPTVKFGGQAVGGIRISHLSHIAEERSISLMVTRGKRAPFVVQPLVDETATHRAALTAATNLTELQIAWAVATKAGVARDASLVALKDARKAELTTPTIDATDPESPDFDPALIGAGEGL